MTQVFAVAATHPGMVRESNEDNWTIDDDLGLYVVCDGMGGHQAGEVASKLAIEAVIDVVRDQQPEAVQQPGGEWEASALLATAEQAVGHACRVVHRTATDNRDKAGMGCTLTMLLVSGPKAVMAHVGDTRLYLVRDGTAHQLSNDHTMAAELARSGAISLAEVKTHQFAHVLTRAIGTHTAVQVDTLTLDVLPGDGFILCSDGLSDYLASEAELTKQIATLEAADLPAGLVAFANDAGGSDNVTVLAVSVATETPKSAVTGDVRDIESQLQALATAPFFCEEFLTHLLRLVDAASVHEYGDGEQILAKGQQSSALFIPIEGTLRATAPDGRSREVGKGEVLGETMLLH